MIEYKTVSLADQVYDTLEYNILTGVYACGEIISETRLSEEPSSVIQPLRFWISCRMDFIRLLAALISRFRFPIFVWIPRFSICRTAAPSWTVGTISSPCLA